MVKACGPNPVLDILYREAATGFGTRVDVEAGLVPERVGQGYGGVRTMLEVVEEFGDVV